MSKHLKPNTLTLLLMLFTIHSVSLATDITFEYKLKALYISRLADFITWPKSTDKQTFKICINPNDLVAIQLKKIKLSDVLNRQVKVTPPPKDLSITQCNFLYLSQGRFDSSLLANSPVLTLSSQAGFAEQGGMIEFYIEQGKVRMKANLKAVNQSGIKLSSKLLRLLKVVKSTGETDG